jgi:delta24(24(1))-sterol reductase
LGQYITAAIIVADVSSIMWYVYGLLSSSEEEKKELSGSMIYDFFMGSILYPRIGIVDIKMVAECRWSWLTLMLLTLSCAVKEYENNGYLSNSMIIMLLAHWLYSNATAKGEHFIPSTWDMFREKFGWMLNFWNVAGVPYMYCFQSFYILKNNNI